MKCRQLQTFIPGDKFKTLPKTVCKGCLRSDGNIEKCHCREPWFICKTTSFNVVLCKCPEHKPRQEWFKKHFNNAIGFDNVKLCNQSLGVVTNNTTLKAATALTGFMKVNNCHVGQSSCPSEVVPV